MPSAHPYTDTGNFSYKRELTGSAFNTLRNLIKIICIDSHEELKSAWHAMADAGMPPEALAVFSDVSIIPYSVAGKGDPGLDSPDALKAAERATELGECFRANYRKAEAIARAAKAKSASR
jgi:hypothetical protein